MDVEDSFQQWRFRHLKTVDRTIGLRQGTGKSAATALLRTAFATVSLPGTHAASNTAVESGVVTAVIRLDPATYPGSE